MFCCCCQINKKMTVTKEKESSPARMMLYAAVEEIFCFPLLCTSRSFLFHIRLSALLAAPSVMFQSECCGAKVLKFFYWLKSSSHPPSSWLRRFFYDSSLKSCEDKLLKIESVKNESKEGSKKVSCWTTNRYASMCSSQKSHLVLTHVFHIGVWTTFVDDASTIN